MKVSIDLLKSVFEKKKYIWYSDRPNLIGIRTELQVPDIFNDLFIMVWKQEAMPNGLNAAQKQKWLNDNLFTGSDGKPLVVDGDFGGKSKFAEQQYLNVLGKERMETYVITTDPGTYWLKTPANKLGSALLKRNQWVDKWALGFHKNKQHPALVQVGELEVHRDNDKDIVAEEATTLHKGLFGINIHRSNATGRTPKIGQWSAGCQVFQVKTDLDRVLAICGLYRTKTGNRFTYTLLGEKDLIS